MIDQELNSLYVFNGLSRVQFDQVKHILQFFQYEKDKMIFKQGQVAEALYILLEGEVQIDFKPYDGPPLTVTQITPGGVFGWSAVLGRNRYTSSAIALENSRACCISTKNLHQLCGRFPDTGAILMDRLASVIAERLRNTHSEVLSMITQGLEMNGKSARRIKNGQH